MAFGFVDSLAEWPTETLQRRSGETDVWWASACGSPLDRRLQKTTLLDMYVCAERKGSRKEPQTRVGLGFFTYDL